MTSDAAHVDGETLGATPRTPGELTTLRPLKLKKRPERRRQEEWRRNWNPHDHCSWPPEDVIIERFRDYVSKRALSIAALSRHKTEPFLTSFKDGIALRETIQDWHRGRIHVKEEPPVSGQVGAAVIIFEEDDDGMRFPWRTTWMAEHDEESTLAFYSTSPETDMVGPGIGRIFYGGCMFLYPPVNIPDVWDDYRFEQSRTPSERLLLAALFWTFDRYVVHVAERPPSREIKQQAAAIAKHIVHLPLSTFSSGTLERLRRAHVLNGREVRSFASRFIT